MSTPVESDSFASLGSRTLRGESSSDPDIRPEDRCTAHILTAPLSCKKSRLNRGDHQMLKLSWLVVLVAVVNFGAEGSYAELGALVVSAARHPIRANRIRRHHLIDREGPQAAARPK
jgi:hypothetical protein